MKITKFKIDKSFEFRNILEFRNQFFMKFRNGMEHELKFLEWIGIGTDIFVPDNSACSFATIILIRDHVHLGNCPDTI